MSKAAEPRKEEKVLRNEWETGEFSRVQSRLDEAARILKMDENQIAPMRHPKRALSVVVPARMDDGTVQTFAGYRVHHDIALGPAKGGISFSPTLNLGSVASIAMLMSWKCALLNLPFGGAHGGICLDATKLSMGEQERITRRYTSEIISLIGPDQDIPGPDLNTSERTMAWIMDTYSVNIGHTVPSVVTGKPRSIGGSLGLTEATGYGVALCAKRAAARFNLGTDATVVIQGLGQVGSSLARSLQDAGFNVIAVSGHQGGVYNPKGLDLKSLQTHIEEHGTMTGFRHADAVSNEELLALKCDILAPCAVPNVISKRNADSIQCKVLVEGANAPTTPQADKILESKGIIVVPDILANASGVTAGYFEWVQGLMRLIWTEDEVYRKLDQQVGRVSDSVFARADQMKISLRLAAITLAVERIWEARNLRGLYP
jgi:glutamate dehydrogenase (NAD(P)+)